MPQVSLKARHIPGQLNVRRQAILSRPDHPDKVVPPSRGLPLDMFLVAPTSSRPVCNQVKQQLALICVTGTRSPSLGSGCTQSSLREPGPIRLPVDSHLEKTGGDVAGQPLQENHSDFSRVAQHALVLGPGTCRAKSPCAYQTCPLC